MTPTCALSSWPLWPSDQDQDGIIKEAEFVALPPGEVDYSFQESDKVWQAERRKEFRTVIDLDGDGILSKDELKVFVQCSVCGAQVALVSCSTFDGNSHWLSWNWLNVYMI